MSVAENKNTIRRWVARVWNQGEFNVAGAIYAPEYVLNNNAGADVRGPAGLADFVRAYRAAVPDLHVEIVDMIGEGDMLAWRALVCGTQSGEFMGIPASGKPIELGAIILSRFEDGVCMEEWVNSDDLGMLQQMGAIPAPGGLPLLGEHAPVAANTMRAEAAALAHNKVISRIYWEQIFNHGELSRADAIAAPDWAIHNPALPPGLRGPEGIKTLISAFRGAFPDIHFIVEDQLAEGDRVVVRVTCTGTHLGAFMGIPATGKPIKLTGMGIDRLAGGKLVEHWGYFDALGLLTQLGAIPAPGAA